MDLAFHLRLRKPIAKSLYPLLELGWYATGGKPYSKSYHELCHEFLLQESTISRGLSNNSTPRTTNWPRNTF